MYDKYVQGGIMAIGIGMKGIRLQKNNCVHLGMLVVTLLVFGHTLLHPSD